MSGSSSPNGGVVALMYHHISPTPGAYTVHPVRFREQLNWLRAAGYQCLTPDELKAYLSGHYVPPAKSVVITFDDGWLDNWAYAAPILRETGFSAILSIVTGWPGRGEIRSQDCLQNEEPVGHEWAMRLVEDDETRDSVVMRWSELRQAEADGVFKLQCHSHTHGGWWSKPTADAVHAAFENDLEQSKSIFYTELGSFPSLYCWPKGQFTRTMRELVTEAGFDLELSTLRGTNTAVREGRLVRRLNVEDRPLPWLRRRIQFYGSPVLACFPALIHQHLQARRLANQYGDRLNTYEFSVPRLSLV